MVKETQTLNKKRKTLIALAAALAVLLGAYFAVTALTRTADSEDETVLFSCEADDITGISYTVDGEEIWLVKDSETWKYATDETFPLDGQKAQALAAAASEVTVTRKLEPKEEKEAYGLKTPKTKITVSLLNGTSAVFEIGNYNATTDSYYMMMEGDNNLYLTSSDIATKFASSLLELASAGQLPESFENGSVTSVTIEDAENKTQITTPVTMKTYTDGFKWQLNIGDITTFADDEAVSKITGELFSLDLSALAAYNADEQKLKEMGFENAVNVTVKYTYTEKTDDEAEEKKSEGTFALKLVKADEENCYYVHIDGDSGVYKCASSDVKSITEASKETLETKKIININIDTVDSMTVEYGGNSYEVTFERTDEETTAKIDGKRVGKSYLEGFIQDLNLLECEGKAENETQGESELKVTFLRNKNDGFKKVTLVFTSYDSSFMSASLLDGGGKLVNFRDVESLKDSFDDILLQAEQ